MAQHIRPPMRQHSGCHLAPKRLHPDDLARLLRPTAARPRAVREWTPSVDYELIASHMHPDAAADYIARSEAWFAAHPPRPPPEPRRRENVDPEAVAALITKYGAAVPLAEYRRIGYSEEAIERVRAHRQWYEDHDEELQAEIERRWPGASKPKPKKVIKAVKKKMPV